MIPPTTPPPNGPPGLPPFAAAGLSQGRVRLSARPAHGPADVERIIRVLRRLRGLRDVELAHLRGDEAHFVVDLARPLPLAADLRAAFGRELLACVRTGDAFALELEPTAADAPSAPVAARAPLASPYAAPPPAGYAPPTPGGYAAASSGGYAPPTPGGYAAPSAGGYAPPADPYPGPPAGGPSVPPAVPYPGHASGAPAGQAAPFGAPPALPAGAPHPAGAAPQALPPRATGAGPAARTHSGSASRRTGGRRTAAKARVGLDQDRRCAVLSIDRDHVVRESAGGLFRAFADDDRPIIGRPLKDLVGPVLRPLFVDHLAAAWRGEPTGVTVRSPDGDRTFDLRFHPPRSRGLGAMASVAAVDVTDEHEAASVARELDTVFEATLASAFVPTALVGADGRWLRANPAFEALLGRRETALLGRLASDLTQIDDRAREAYLRDQALRAGEASFELEKRMVRADGGVIVVIGRTAILREGDAVRGYVVQVVPEVVAEALPRPQAPVERPRRRLLRRPGRGGGGAAEDAGGRDGEGRGG